MDLDDADEDLLLEEEEELADGNSGSGTAKSNLKEIWDNKWKQRYDDLVVSTL